MVKKKKQYLKPKLEAKKLDAYFFNCLKKVSDPCTSIVVNRLAGSGCPMT